MKRLLFILVLTGSLVCAEETAQSPSNRIDARDDSEAVQAKLGKMEFLDDSVPLKVGDKISIRIVEDKDKTLSLLVQDSGQVTFPHVGLLKAEGLTAKALAFVAKRELEKEFFKNAKVIVALEPRCMGSCPAPPHGPSFTIFGQVARQGRYELVKGETLTIVEAIARAGGLNIAAKGEGKLIRKTAKGTNSTIFDVKSLTKNNSEKEVIVQDRDVLILFER